MNARLGLLLMTVCLTAFAGDQPGGEHPWDGDPPNLWGKANTLYMKGDASEEIECGGGSVTDGRVMRDCGSLTDWGGGYEIFFDCSNIQYECLYNGGVMAVPRAGLAEGQNYTVFGANLTVEHCFGDQTTCDIARVRSECAIASGSEVCG